MSATFFIHKYLKQFQENPQSRIFAPLAEAYRKTGHPEEAIRICHEGLLHHPHFIGGKVAIARAYFDQKNYAKVIEVLQEVCQQAPDNIIAQKLIAESYLLTQRMPEALEAFKNLLFFSPNDTQIHQLIVEMETNLFQIQDPLLKDLPTDPLIIKTKKAQQVQKLMQFLQKLERHYHRLSLQPSDPAVS